MRFVEIKGSWRLGFVHLYGKLLLPWAPARFEA